MDANNVVTSFIASADQYAVNRTETNLKQLQRHFEILVCLTSDESNLTFFQNHLLLSSQCITLVTNVFLDGSMKQTLIPRALSVLQNLLKNATLFKNLQSTFHIHSALSTFLQQYGVNTKDPLVLQSFQVLEDITYNIKIDYIENHFESLICVLINLIDAESPEFVKISLHILSNVCRNNPRIQNYICSLPDLKQIVKKLVSILNTSMPSVILYSLSILSSITPYNNFGTKLWTDEHLMMTFELIMRLLFCDDQSCAATAVDLFTDLIASEKYESCFKRSRNYVKCLKKISNSLSDVPPKRAILFLKFLFAVTKSPEILEKMCSFICLPNSESNSSQCLKINPVLVDWCMNNDKTDKSLQQISLELVKCILSFYIGDNFCIIEDDAKIILQNILENMILPVEIDDSLWEDYLESKIIVFEMLCNLCHNIDFQSFISKHINIEICIDIAKLVLNKYASDSNITFEPSVNLFLMIVETVILLGQSLTEFPDILSRLLDNDGAVHCLSYALTSSNSELVKRSLSLISKSNGRCPVNVLSESLCVRNMGTFKSSNGCSDSGESPLSSQGLPTAKKPHLSLNKISEKSIDALLSKIDNGLQIKDLKSSEIMDLYEHKIAMLTLKEQELQSYVEAKTAALHEADRILTQYKCRQADADAETLRLRYMMKDYEYRCEQSASQLSFAEQKQRKMEANFVESCQRIKELEQNYNEQKEMTQTQLNRLSEQKRNVEEEKSRLSEQLVLKDQEKKALMTQLLQCEDELRMKEKAYEDLNEVKEELVKSLEESKRSIEKIKMNSEQKQQHLQKLIESAQQTITSLEEKNENLNNEMTRKIDEFTHEISDLENQKEQLAEQLKSRDSKIEDLNDNLKNLNDLLNEKNCVLHTTETTLNKIKVVLEQTEAQRIKLQQDKKMMELLCKKYEASIEEKDDKIQALSDDLEAVRKEYNESVSDKDNEIKNLQEELAKHEYIAGMIHNLTSGKLNVPK
ncbi:protein CIP2A [Trichonephila inaurata madagascariensis]|uniref:Protein CIP2A n=1 Tax=Trichonephila inaurata madagascariensis TaxID=2747483 RepID=A0A8X7C5S3_9ARAC|nr:protein CIP2A [Trichonephila inaurata madagascariensis]